MRGNGIGNVHIQREFPEALEQAFDERVDVFALDEAHFDVELGEFELAVGALVFVAKAAGELVVFLDAGDHEDLFELLRGLRQGVKGARLAAVGHQEFARAFGGGFEQDGRLDFHEALFVHVEAGGGGDFAAQPEVARHFRPAQVQVAILQAEFFVDGAGDFRVVHRKGEHLGHVQHFQGGGGDLDFAGGNFGIVGAGGAGADFAGDGDDAFAAEGGGALEKLPGQIGGVEDGLGAAFAVADINKDEAAEVAAGMDPAGEDDGLARRGRAAIGCNGGCVSWVLAVGDGMGGCGPPDADPARGEGAIPEAEQIRGAALDLKIEDEDVVHQGSAP